MISEIESKLKQVRTKEEDVNEGQQIFHSIMLFVFGGVLGYVSKWLDLLELDSGIGWHRVLERLDLANVLSALAVWMLLSLAIAVCSSSPARAALNVFLFLAAMCLSYHVYTILHGGFNPLSYMMGWYILSALSTLLAAVCWYGKGVGTPSVVIDVLILAVMTCACFSVGHWYIGFHGALNAVFYAVSVILLHRNAKWTSISVLGGLVLALVFSPFFPQ